MANEERTELRITDPVSLRALAHPARQRLITELFAGEVLTATEAAKIVGLSPSATSYHLRALEQAGIVVRGDASTDARQRPWRAAADSISVRPEAHRAAGAHTSQTSLLGWVADLEGGVARMGKALADGRDDVGTVSRARLWLSKAEVEDLGEQIDQLLQVYRDRSRHDHPDEALPWDSYLLLLPTEGTPEA